MYNCYEIPEHLSAQPPFNGDRYFVKYIDSRFEYKRLGTFWTYNNLLQVSTRVWKEFDDGKVIYLKHREKELGLAEVDMKEFIWIKLKALEV